MELRKKGDAVKRRTCIALTLLLALAAPAALLAAEAPVQPAPSSAPAPATTSGAACAPAPNAGLFSPAAASPIETPWEGAVELTSCDCSGFDCGPGCYPYVCVLLHGRCGAICKCNP